MYAVWCSETNLGISDFNLVASIFKMISYVRDKREIGLKYFNDSICRVLGE